MPRIALVSRCLRSLRIAAFAFAVSATGYAQQYTRTDLTADVSSTSSTAANLDPNLVNAWGLSRSSGSPWWVSDNGTGLSTLYNAAGVAQLRREHGSYLLLRDYCQSSS